MKYLSIPLLFLNSAFLILLAKPAYATNQGRFTISVWVNPTTSIASKAIIAKAEELRLVTDASGNPLCQFKTTTWQTASNAASQLPLNTWSHVLCTYDLTNLKIYVNGVLKGTTALTAVPDDTSAVFYAGRDASASTTYGFFSGIIDEFKFYNYNLTLDEILIDYNRGAALQLGTKSTGAGNTAPATASSQVYCIPGDTAVCSPPVAEWLMDEGIGSSAYDTSGNGNNGGLGAGSAAPTWATGKIGKGLRFDGGNDYASTGTNLGLSGDFSGTISAWIKRVGGTDFQSVVVTGSAVALQSFSIGINGNGEGSFSAEFNGGKGRKSAAGLIPLNTWVHLAVVKTPGAIESTTKLYLNGVEVAQATGQTGTPNFVANLSYIGTWTNLAYYFNGLIDQVRIYNYARTPAQIAWDYNKGAPVAHYKLDECQGTVVHSSAVPSAVEGSGTLVVGASGSQNTAGTCSLGVGQSSAWANGSSGKYNASLNFDGTDDYVSVGTGFTAQSVSFWVKPTSTTSSIMQLSASAYISASSGLISASGFSSPTIYVNGVPSTTLTADTWQMVTVATATGVSAGAIKLGLANSTYYSGQLDDIKIWNYPLTSAQIKNEFNQGAVRFGD